MKHFIEIVVLLIIAKRSSSSQVHEDVYVPAIECISQSVTNESIWACGYCIDIKERGNKRAIRGQKMENGENCDIGSENGK